MKKNYYLYISEIVQFYKFSSFWKNLGRCYAMLQGSVVELSIGNDSPALYKVEHTVFRCTGMRVCVYKIHTLH